MTRARGWAICPSSLVGFRVEGLGFRFLGALRVSRLLGGEGLGRKLVKVPPRKSFRQHGINYAEGQVHAKAAGRVTFFLAQVPILTWHSLWQCVGVLLCSAVF